MRFWDSSAIIPLVFAEAASDGARRALAEDRAMAVWWSTEVECASALARRERETALPADVVAAAAARFNQLAGEWFEIAPTREIRETAKRLLRLHTLTAADALQLAAALAVAENDPASLAFVTLDDRLREAASRQGLQVLP